MSPFLKIIVDAIERAENDIIEAIEEALHRHPHHHRKKHIVSGRFGPLVTINPLTGEFFMSLQLTVVGTQYTGPVQFFMTDGSLATTPGPVGALTVDNPLVTVGLSADGQSYNVLTTGSLGVGGKATLTWTDPAGKIPSFATEVSDEAVAPTIATGGFGPLVPGNTP